MAKKQAAPVKEKTLPKVDLVLVGYDGNVFSIIGRFRGAAKKAGWSDKDIEAVTADAMSGTYDHAVATVLKHCKDPVNGTDSDDRDDDCGDEDYDDETE